MKETTAKKALLCLCVLLKSGTRTGTQTKASGATGATTRCSDCAGVVCRWQRTHQMLRRPLISQASIGSTCGATSASQHSSLVLTSTRVRECSTQNGKKLLTGSCLNRERKVYSFHHALGTLTWVACRLLESGEKLDLEESEIFTFISKGQETGVCLIIIKAKLCAIWE